MNIAGGEELAILDLVHKVVELTQSRSRVEIGVLPYRPNEIWRMRETPLVPARCSDGVRG